MTAQDIARLMREAGCTDRQIRHVTGLTQSALARMLG